MTTSTEIVDGAVSMLQDRCRLLEESLRNQGELLEKESARASALAVLLAGADWALAQAVEMARKIAQEDAVLREVFIGPITQAALDRHAARHKGEPVSLERVAP